MRLLLDTVTLDARLSLEPVFVLIAVLARDLQADCIPFLPRILSKFSDFVDSGLVIHCTISHPAHSLHPVIRLSAMHSSNLSLGSAL